MAYMNQEKKAKIAGLIKPILKKYGVKATLAVRNNAVIVLNIKSGKIDFIDNFLSTGKIHDPEWIQKYRNIDVNPYWYQDHFTGEAKDFLTEAFSALKGADWYDESDAQVDYFNTAYYVDVNIGKWNKPYQVI
jgi:hypothetical protein